MTRFLSIIEIGRYVSKIDEWTDDLQSYPAHLLQSTTKPTTVLNYLQSPETPDLINPW